MTTSVTMTTSVKGIRGFEILRAAVTPDLVDRALRHLHLDLVRRGAPADTIGSWLWASHWFPHLRWDPEVTALLNPLPERLRDGELCDPQILLQPPDTAKDIALEPHVDREPDWAGGRRYARILGVALSPNRRTNGGLVVWPLDGSEPQQVELEPGDVVVMDPGLPHTSGLNREGAIRYAVYFRFLQAS
jgi:hypothetical protein